MLLGAGKRAVIRILKERKTRIFPQNPHHVGVGRWGGRGSSLAGGKSRVLPFPPFHSESPPSRCKQYWSLAMGPARKRRRSCSPHGRILLAPAGPPPFPPSRFHCITRFYIRRKKLTAKFPSTALGYGGRGGGEAVKVAGETAVK